MTGTQHDTNQANEPPNVDKTSTASSAGSEPKKSWYRRYQDAKTGRNVQLDDEELKKYTGMTKAQLGEWSQDRPGVAANQAAGKLTVGPTTGVGGYETSQGYGGWGPGAANDQLKFPPQQSAEHQKGTDSESRDSV